MFGGTAHDNTLLNSMECLDVAKLLRGEAVQWALIETNLVAQFFNFFYPLNKREILILGGRDASNAMIRDEAFLLDTDNLSLKTVSWD